MCSTEFCENKRLENVAYLMLKYVWRIDTFLQTCCISIITLTLLSHCVYIVLTLILQLVILP